MSNTTSFRKVTYTSSRAKPESTRTDRLPFTGQSGQETSLGESDVADNVLDSTITRGSGDPGSTASQYNNDFDAVFGNSGVPTTSSAVLSDNNYLQFNVQTAPGYTVSLSSIDAIYDGAKFGYPPVTADLAYSLNGGTSWTLLPTFSITSSQFTQPVSVNLSGVSALQDASSVEFRLFASGSSATASFGFENNDATSEYILGSDGSQNGLVINGTEQVEAAPEPSSWTLVVVGGFGLTVLRWRTLRSTREDFNA